MIRQHLIPHRFSHYDELKRLGESSRCELGPVIRILVWNILKARHNRWSSDFLNLSQDRDLVLLQESVLNAPSDPVFRKDRRMQWLMARSFRQYGSGVEHGIKTGCTAPALEQAFYLSPATEPVAQTRKLLLSTQYALQGTSLRLLVLNMHAINFVGMKKYLQQLEQLAFALQSHKGPVILAGDFNTWSGLRKKHFEAVARHAGLAEAAMERQSRLSHFKQHLDHVFYRGLTLRHVASLEHYQSSDHAPITATFECNLPEA